MGCPSMIYTVLTNTEVTEGGGAGFGTPTRRYGGALRLDGSGIALNGSGYFDIDATLSFTPEAAGPVTIQFFQDGQPLAGALSTGQGTASQPLPLHVTGEARNCGRCSSSTLTYTISAAGTIDVLTTRVEKD